MIYIVAKEDSVYLNEAMIDQKIEDILQQQPKSISDENFALLLEYAGQKQALVKKEEWASLIERVKCIISERCCVEDGLAFVESTYKSFVCAFPNAFNQRMTLLESLCLKYLELGDFAKAHICMDRYVFVAMAELNFHSNYSGARCYSFRPFTKYSLDDVRNETLSVAHPREFNDPLDTLLQFRLKWELEKQRGEDELELKRLLLLKKVCDNIKMRCLISSKYQENGTVKTRAIEDLSFLMWSHYAKSHTGFCVEYEFDRSLFEVDNQQERQILVLGGVTYPETITMTGDLSFQKLLFEKSNFWQYEQELRLVRFEAADISTGNNKEEFPVISCRGMIKAVYLGVKCSEKDRLNMVKAIGDKDIPLFQMTIDDENLGRLSKKQIG